MDHLDRMFTLVQRAAELLPGPPRAHDAYGYLAWEELAMDTVVRIGELAGPDLPQLMRLSGARLPKDGVLDERGLLWLAGMVAHDSHDLQSVSSCLRPASRLV